MGYRSNIRVMTDLEGFEKMCEIAYDIAKEERISNDNVLFPIPGNDPENFYDYYDAQKEYLCFGIDWVKWYDGYENVDLFMDVLEEANQNGVAWQFIRTGEDYGDVENFSSDNFYDNPFAVMGVSMEITY